MYREEAPASFQRTIVALHGYGHGAEQPLPLARSLGEGLRVLAPEAARPVSPLGYSGTESAGQLWYYSDRPYFPEPPLFGDHLGELEAFVFDALDDASNRGVRHELFLLGLDQGAVMALSLACYWPDLLSGVIAIQGGLPTIPNWSLPDTDMASLPVLLVHDTDEDSAAASSMAAAELRNKGARPELARVEGAGSVSSDVVSRARVWMDRQLRAVGNPLAAG